MVNEIRNSILLTIECIESITNQFYQQKNSEAYDNLLKGLSDITDIINKLIYLKTINPNFQFNEYELLDTLKNAMNALEEKDTILLADILHYDLNKQLSCISGIILDC